MKRVFAIAICFAIFYAGAVWALAACEKLNSLSSQHKSAALFDSHHHRADHDSNHSHSGSGAAKVHCPGLFGEFLLTARASLGSGYSPVEHKNYLVSPLIDSAILLRRFKDHPFREPFSQQGLFRFEEVFRL